jgi:hypothetical protein
MSGESVQAAILHRHCDDTEAAAVWSHDKVESKVLDEEQAVVFKSHAVEGVQNSVSCAVSGGSAAVSLAAFPKLKGLTSKRTLVDFALVSTAER